MLSTWLLMRDNLCIFVDKYRFNIDFAAISPSATRSYEMTEHRLRIDEIEVICECAKPVAVLKFAPHSYLSSSQNEILEAESIESGYRFIDTLSID